MLATFWDLMNPKKWVGLLARGIFRGAKRFFCWVVLTALDWSTDVMAYIVGFFPSPPEWMGTIVEFLGLVNQWFPVDAALFCAATYYTFIAVIGTVRIVKSFIPTLGG